MSKTISLEDASPDLASLVRDVEEGEEVLITRQGRLVARISSMVYPLPPGPERDAAVARMIGFMEKGYPLGAGPLDREVAHER